jgi:hypothetical protein
MPKYEANVFESGTCTSPYLWMQNLNKSYNGGARVVMGEELHLSLQLKVLLCMVLSILLEWFLTVRNRYTLD